MLLSAALFQTMSVAEGLDNPFTFAPPYLDLTLAGWTAFTDNLKLHKQIAELASQVRKASRACFG